MEECRGLNEIIEVVKLYQHLADHKEHGGMRAFPWKNDI